MVESVVVVIVQLSLEKTERGLNRRMVWVGFRDAHRQRISDRKSGNAKSAKLGHRPEVCIGDEAAVGFR